ncbi:DUF257 family protein [Thermococcus gammatolerans]|uniref:Uncharacterized protein n=1 Tax=Thermococcus gammatolerans (strain DSM 15229 / JCM 11827 / EJ3) TaxID=593117 RepID=C5A2I8_THEGJ|nr:DUF257 family protein [Thermococcus gammatolerans]ACS34607.1 Conserved hypothetical protein [Thermococcus gammatolerans EJ3]
MGKIESFFSGLKFGETVLVEYPSNSYPELFLKLLHDYASSRGLHVLVDDILDAYPVLVKGLKSMGLPPGETVVIKIGGGRLEAGTIISRMEVDKYSIPFGHYMNSINKFREANGRYFNPVVGIHRMVTLFSEREMLSLLTTISYFVGDDRRVSFYLINEDVIESSKPVFLPLFEEIATTVTEWYLDGDELVLVVHKAANPELLGKEYRVKVSEFFG